MEKKIFYQGTFRAERIVDIANRFGVDPTAVLDNIIVARAYTHETQIQLLTLLAAKMAEEQFSLLICDSATALFRVDFSGRGELAERQVRRSGVNVCCAALPVFSVCCCPMLHAKCSERSWQIFIASDQAGRRVQHRVRHLQPSGQRPGRRRFVCY